jgi:hypothetical protein
MERSGGSTNELGDQKTWLLMNPKIRPTLVENFISKKLLKLCLSLA